MPGSGKSATAHKVLKSQDLVTTNMLHINGMRLKNPQQVYVALWQKIRGKKDTPERAMKLLEAYFANVKELKESHPLYVVVSSFSGHFPRQPRHPRLGC